MEKCISMKLMKTVIRKKILDKNVPGPSTLDGERKVSERITGKKVLEDNLNINKIVSATKDTHYAAQNISSQYHEDNLKGDTPGRLNGSKDPGLINTISMEDKECSEDYGEEEDPDDAFKSGESFWCSLCDDGGNLLFCDGPCLRSFHACLSEQEKEEGKTCITLGFTEKEFKAIESELSTWLCPNCEDSSQLCFVCKRLGKSVGPKKEVFNCDAAHCGQFYHPMCVARVLTKNPSRQRVYADSIGQGVETFLCPLHKCKRCKKLEEGTDIDTQFAKCRRCPAGWHVQCLPSTMPFEEDVYLDIPQRAWRVPVGEEDHQFRVGIYCPNHALPLQPSDMVRFPHSPVARLQLAGQISLLQEAARKKLKDNGFAIPGKEKRASVEEESTPPKATNKKVPGSESRKGSGILTEVRESSDVGNSSRRQYSFHLNERPPKYTAVAADTSLDNDSLPQLSDMYGRVDEIIIRSQELKTAQEVKKELRISKYFGDQKVGQDGGKFIHDGELSSILNSIPKALNCLTQGNGITEAKCLCPVKSILQLGKVEKNMKVYLNPCLHGQRYSSYGRHFTTKDKLVEIVDRLHWYIDDRDMVVDFCCGANDFSIEVNRKLMEAGKRNCEFKNYDIFAPKENFHFEQRDWFTVQPGELPSGDRLIMGLNPPFGAIANSFIEWATMFRPKIIVLIVPAETRRLEGFGYELIWEDAKLLGGRTAFYLPGSVKITKDTEKDTEVETMMEDWNKTPPPLYLWSRSDLANKHRQIAAQHGQIKYLGPPLQHLEPQNNIIPPHFQPVDISCNPVKVLVRPPYLEVNNPDSPWLGGTVISIPTAPIVPNMGRPSGLRPAPCLPIAPNGIASGSVQADWFSPVNHTPFSSTAPDPNGLSNKHPARTSPVLSGSAVFNAESDDSPCASLEGSSPCLEPLISNESDKLHPTKSKSFFKSQGSMKRPLKTDAISKKGDDTSEDAPKAKKQFKKSLPNYDRQRTKFLHQGREAVNEMRHWEVLDRQGRRGEDGSYSGNCGVTNTGGHVNRDDPNCRKSEEGHAAVPNRGQGFHGVHRKTGAERGRAHEGAEPMQTTHPNWHTTRASTGALAQDELSLEAEAGPMETDLIEFPTPHGSYEVCASPPSPTPTTEYSGWQGRNYRGAAMHHHHLQDMLPDWSRSNPNGHLFPDNPPGFPGFRERPIFPIHGGSVPPQRPNFNQGHFMGARDYQFTTRAGSPPPSNDYWGPGNSNMSQEGLWNRSAASCPPPPANQTVRRAPVAWRAPQPYF